MSPPSILFISRGRGYGHAVTDLELARELAELKVKFQWRYCSYGTGAGVFRSRGEEVIDLGLPDESSPIAVLMGAALQIERLSPQLIISHEELFIPVGARIRGIPSIYLSTWLPPLGSIGWEAIEAADAILVIEDEGLFPFPPAQAKKIKYSGPVVRKMRCGLTDRTRLRGELGYGPEATVWMVIPGGWATEGRAPISQTVLAAFRKLSETNPDTHLLWLGDSREPAIQATPRVRLIPFCDHIERYMSASDVVFTKGTHGITLEAAQLGVPSISISHKTNPVDEVLVPRIGNNTHFHALAVTPETLLREAQRVRNGRPGFVGRDYSGGRTLAAQMLAADIVKLITPAAR